MEQKTIKEAAEKYYIDNIFCDGITEFEHDIAIRCYIAGAKWQQERMYSEEDLKQAINLAFVFSGGMSENETYQDCELFCFEQFKKK